MTGVIDRPVIPLGLPDPNLRIIGSGLSDGVDFGTGAVVYRLIGSGLLDSPDFGTGSVSTGPVSVVDDETDDYPVTFGSGSVLPGVVGLAGSGLTDSIEFGTGIATIGGITVIDDEVDDFPVTFGSGSISTTYSISGSGLGDTPTFGDGVVSPGTVTLSGYGIWPDTKYGHGAVEPTRYYFVGPELRYGHGRRNSPLWWVENVDGITLLRESGVWRETITPTGDEIAAAERAYRGGYRTELTGTQKNELVAAGYGSYIEED